MTMNSMPEMVFVFSCIVSIILRVDCKHCMRTMCESCEKFIGGTIISQANDQKSLLVGRLVRV